LKDRLAVGSVAIWGLKQHKESVDTWGEYSGQDE